jgi:hypothetical protein
MACFPRERPTSVPAAVEGSARDAPQRGAAARALWSPSVGPETAWYVVHFARGQRSYEWATVLITSLFVVATVWAIVREGWRSAFLWMVLIVLTWIAHVFVILGHRRAVRLNESIARAPGVS